MPLDVELENTREASARLVGRVLLNTWKLERPIGYGGMSTVYEASHRNGTFAAVKVLHPHLAAHPRTRRRFLREGFLANKVGHGGAVSILDDAVDDDGTVFLVMELLHGETLSARIGRQGQMPLREAIGILDDVLAVLESAHERGIVHRDLKPSNIFLTSTGAVKVLDFGIARLREDACRGTETFSTQLGTMLGTPGFMAPEQARGAWNEVDGRTDIWALGATMFVALTGRPVHRGSTPNEMVIAAATQAAPPISQHVKLPSAIGDIIDRALRLNAEDRWPTASAFREALTHARRTDRVDDGALAPAAVTSHDGDRHELRRRGPVRVSVPIWAIGGALAATVVLAVKSLALPHLRGAVESEVAPGVEQPTPPRGESPTASPESTAVAARSRAIDPPSAVASSSVSAASFPHAASMSRTLPREAGHPKAGSSLATTVGNVGTTRAGAESAASRPAPHSTSKAPTNRNLLDRWQ